MIIIVRIGLGLAYQGASSTSYHRGDYHDPPPSSSTVPSFGNGNKEQLSTFQAASHRDDNNNLQSISLGDSSSRTKLDVGTESESRVAGNDVADRDSGERNGEKEGKTG